MKVSHLLQDDFFLYNSKNNSKLQSIIYEICDFFLDLVICDL